MITKINEVDDFYKRECKSLLNNCSRLEKKIEKGGGKTTGPNSPLDKKLKGKKLGKDKGDDKTLKIEDEEEGDDHEKLAVNRNRSISGESNQSHQAKARLTRATAKTRTKKNRLSAQKLDSF